MKDIEKEEEDSPRIAWPAPESKSYLAIVGSQSDHVN